jgi:RNA polymerase primary sigma factor
MQKQTNDTMDQLLKEVRTVELLSKNDSLNLLEKMKKGCQKSKKLFVTSNIRLVISIAKQYQNKGIPIADLIQEGAIGLIRAAEKFDLSKDIQFSTYATWWIKQKIRRALTNQVKMIKIPDHLYHQSIQLNDELYTKNTPPNELSKKLNLTKKQYRNLAALSGPILSLEMPSHFMDNNESLGDILSDNAASTLNTDCAFEKTNSKDQINHLLSQLNERQRTVLTLRYGLNDNKPRTQKQIGDFLNISAERIRQLEQQSIRQLQKVVEKKDLQMAFF